VVILADAEATRRSQASAIEKPGPQAAGAIDLRHHGFLHLVQDAGDFHAAPQISHLGLERQRRPPPRPSTLTLAADTERAARAP